MVKSGSRCAARFRPQGSPHRVTTGRTQREHFKSAYPPESRHDRAEPPLPSRAISGREQSQQGSSYSITSSARASSVSGTVIPSALAVFILMTSLKRVGCSTGKSAGWAPLRILSTYTAALRKRSAYIAEYDISPPSSTNQRGTETAGTRCCSARSAARLLGRLG